jgi:hypothetical protein
MHYPEMYPVRQLFARERVDDFQPVLRAELDRTIPSDAIQPGARVAITCGSRGIRNIDLILRGVVDYVRNRQGQPFIFPAMGSHGGGTADGQARVLAHYGVTGESMGCPVLSDMATVQIGMSAEGIPVFLDRHASTADHVIVVNRVKPHTEFKGEIESGIMKMMLIGMGKQEGARVYHKAFADYGFDRLVESLASVVIEKARILCAVAIVENAYDETAILRALAPGEIVASERDLLRKAKSLAAKLPFDEIDLLIVDAMGKNISGSGMDTNVIGRFYNIVAAEPSKPRIKRIYVRDLTEESMGNATGIGLADFAHRRVVDKMDSRVTSINCLIAGNPEKGRVPIVCESDLEGLEYSLGTIGLTEPENARVVRIQDTLHLTRVDISGVLVRETGNRGDLELLGGSAPLQPDSSGEIGPMPSLPAEFHVRSTTL